MVLKMVLKAILEKLCRGQKLEKSVEQGESGPCGEGKG